MVHHHRDVSLISNGVASWISLFVGGASVEFGLGSPFSGGSGVPFSRLARSCHIKSCFARTGRRVFSGLDYYYSPMFVYIVQNASFCRTPRLCCRILEYLTLYDLLFLLLLVFFANNPCVRASQRDNFSLSSLSSLFGNVMVMLMELEQGEHCERSV